MAGKRGKVQPQEKLDVRQEILLNNNEIMTAELTKTHEEIAWRVVYLKCTAVTMLISNVK